MKSLAAELAATRRGEVPSADNVPFGALVRPDVVKLRGKTAFAATWRIGGVPFETCTHEVLGAKLEYLSGLYRNLTGGNLSYWYHRICRNVNTELGHSFTGFAKQLDSRYTAWQGERGYSLFESYLTVIFHPQLRGPKMWFGKNDVSADQLRTEHSTALKQFEAICSQAEASLGEFRPQRLGVFIRQGREYSELGTFYGFLLNGFWRDQPLYRAPLAQSIPHSHLHFGDRNGRLQINSGDQTRFAGLLEIVDYPPEGYAGDLDAILGLGAEFIETHSFSTMDRTDAERALRFQLNQAISSEEGSEAEIEVMEDKIEEVRDGRIVAGSYHFSLALFGDTLDDVQRYCSAVRREISAYRMEDSRLIPEATWFAQLPGNWDFRPRLGVMTSLNFAGLAPMHTPPTGKFSGNPWGEAVAVLRGTSNQPFGFNFHAPAEDLDRLDDKDPGNTAVFGSIGTGKTAFVGFLLCQAQRFRPRILFLDKDRGAEILIRALGGSYTLFKRGEHTGINIFQWPDSDTTRALCRRVVEACVRREGTVLSAKDEMDIGQAVNSVFDSLSHGSRRLAAVNQFLPGGEDNDLSVALQKWIGDNYLSWVLDSPDDRLGVGDHRIYGFDYTVFLDDAEIRDQVMLVMMALRDRLIDGSPFISVMDEFWKAYESDVLADDDKNKQKTGRKQSMISVLMSQSVTDALDHRHARTLVEQTNTKVFLPNPEASREDYVGKLGLSEREYTLIKDLGTYSRKALVRQSGYSVVLNIDMAGLSEELITLSGSLDNVMLLDGIRATHGDNPEVWQPLLIDAVRQRKASKAR